jgi:hypothetical protein
LNHSGFSRLQGVGEEGVDLDEELFAFGDRVVGDTDHKDDDDRAKDDERAKDPVRKEGTDEDEDGPEGDDDRRAQHDVFTLP